MTGGRLIGVVGPSGVGKDTVMQAVAARRPELDVLRRVITRPADAGGEVFTGVDEDTFAALVAAGDLALHWRAHGLRYGIPVRECEGLAAGRDALVNLSRAALPEAQRRFAGFTVLSLTAPPGVLAARLAGRGREPAQEIAARLARADHGLSAGLERVVSVDNAGALQETVAAVLAELYPERV